MSKNIDKDNDTTYNDTMHDEDTDIVFEDDDTGASAIQKLRDRLNVCVKEKQEYMDGWQRAQADFQNYKREQEKAHSDLKNTVIDRFVEDLLPILDSFDMAFANSEVWQKVDEEWRQGIEHIHAQYVQVLEQYAVSQINPLNETFDPTRHESINTVDVDDPKQDHVVLSVLQKGYMRNGRIIRPAKVTIGIYAT